jgi:hypothetical protein
MTSDFKPVLMPEKRDLMVKIYFRNGLFSMVLSNYFYFDISSIYSISVKVRRKTIFKVFLVWRVFSVNFYCVLMIID